MLLSTLVKRLYVVGSVRTTDLSPPSHATAWKHKQRVTT